MSPSSGWPECSTRGPRPTPASGTAITCCVTTCTTHRRSPGSAGDTRCPLIYASSSAVYGVGTEFSEDRSNEAPVNEYAESKKLFDDWVRAHLLAAPRAHRSSGYATSTSTARARLTRGRWRASPTACTASSRPRGRVQLFAGSCGFDAGEQRRLFFHVADGCRRPAGPGQSHRSGRVGRSRRAAHASLLRVRKPAREGEPSPGRPSKGRSGGGSTLARPAAVRPRHYVLC
jgi:hypothetical protein